MKKIILASSNPGKVKEFSTYFSGLKIELISQSALGIKTPRETGMTFIENAIIKARHASSSSGLSAIADDSGLVVPALGGAPGIFSARYAGDGATDAQNNLKLLENMSNLSHESRKCFFVCVIVYMRYATDYYPIVSSGSWKGIVGNSPNGGNGFGYDPVFIDPNSGKTAAQLDSETKFAHSHRGEALRNLTNQLINELAKGN